MYIHDSAENIIRLAKENVATGTRADRACIVLPPGHPHGLWADELAAAGLATSMVVYPYNDEQRAEILSALAKSSSLEIFY